MNHVEQTRLGVVSRTGRVIPVGLGCQEVRGVIEGCDSRMPGETGQDNQRQSFSVNDFNNKFFSFCEIPIRIATIKRGHLKLVGIFIAPKFDDLLCYWTTKYGKLQQQFLQIPHSTL